MNLNILIIVIINVNFIIILMKIINIHVLNLKNVLKNIII